MSANQSQSGKKNQSSKKPPRLSAAFVPTRLDQHEQIIKQLPQRYRIEVSRNKAKKGYESATLPLLSEELPNVEDDQLRESTSLQMNQPEWFNKYSQMFPTVEGIIAIEELNQDNVPMAVAQAIMERVDRHKQQPPITQPMPLTHLHQGAEITTLFYQAVI